MHGEPARAATATPHDVEASIARAILDAADVAAFAVDGAGSIVYQNALARRMSAALQARCVALTVDARDATGRCALSVDGDGARWRGWVWPLSSEIIVGVAQRSAPARSVTEAVAAALGIGIADARLAMRVARGLSNQRIAEAVGVPVGTLNTRLWRLYRRLGVGNRADLAARVGHVVATSGDPGWGSEPLTREVEK